MTIKTIDVNVHHLARVEGHGNIVVRIKGGAVEEARWQVVETPRFFEVMLKGKHYSSAGILTARICGICSIGHCLASVRATEQALGLEIPERAAALRLLAKHGETLQSHLLHLVFLAAPDFLGLTSALPLAHTHPELFASTARLKGLANRLCDVVAGRTTHFGGKHDPRDSTRHFCRDRVPWSQRGVYRHRRGCDPHRHPDAAEFLR